MMGGFGVIQSMINTIKQNKNLLRERKSIYTHKYNYRGKIAHQKPSQTTLSATEIERIQTQIITERKKQKRKQLYTLLAVFGVLIILISGYDSITYKTSSITPSKATYITPKNRVYDYHSLMSLGYANSNANQWFFALGYFEKALTAKPLDSIAKYELVKSYCSLCFYEKKACFQAKEILKELISIDSLNKDYHMLQQNCLQSEL